MQKFEPLCEEVETVLDTFDPQDLQAEMLDKVAAQIEQDRLNSDNQEIYLDRVFLDKDNLPETTGVRPQKKSSKQLSLTADPLMTDPQFNSHVQYITTAYI
ncbi:hypothetical protein DPMN_097966 [Dreissena polymorpha]|uniref:Uncharacterized protein n=1 Tax=Dreissena polymorpha TaxID=45954 RepID=A0A9D4LCP1_DREPO|nr:hypothetical protein DPMN_097966 [Dreissena polymorpha]